MFSITTNIFIFAVYFLILIVEFIFFKLLDLSYGPAWMITTLFYIAVIAYQVLLKTNEYLEKTKVREIIVHIMDTINGIPLLNQDDKLIIKWDIIFKKLIDKKEYVLYDNIIKVKTKTIDHLVNQYPSLLLDSSTDMLESNHNIDLNTVLSSKGSKPVADIRAQEINEELKNKLYVKYLSGDKITFANYDSSIYLDIVVNDEFEPQNYEKLGIRPDKRYDGFSVVAFYKSEKYSIVNRTMVFNKRIDKEKWLYRNIDRLMQCAENIIAGIQEYSIIVDDLALKEITSDYIDNDSGRIPFFHFECIEDNLLIFSGVENGKELVKAYCSLTTNHNGFEINLERYELIIEEQREIVEDEKTVAIGNSYQPLITIMEKMPVITNNIRMAISKKDIDDIVIKS
ncbi:MAG: hypothetical protein ACM3TR_11330 [Caulobacteraceae bacterium]